jgi:hypothetical protein
MIVCFNTCSLNTLKVIYMLRQQTIVCRRNENLCILSEYITYTCLFIFCVVVVAYGHFSVLTL